MSEWPTVKLGEVAEQTNHRVGELDVPIYSVTKYDGFVPSSEYFKKRVFSMDIRKYKLCTAGDFAYATIHLDEGSIGISPVKCGISPMYTTFRLNSLNISPDYLLRYLKSSRALTQYLTLGSGSAERRKSIKFTDLRKMEIPFPPLGEQNRIVGILGKTTGAISSVQKQIEQAKKLRSSIVGMASKMAVELRAISEYFDINPRQPRNIPDNAPTSFVPMANLDETFGISPITSRFSEHKKGYTYFENGDILLAKITPCFENGKSAIAKLSTQIGHGSTEFHVLRHKNHMHQDVCLSPLLVAAILKQPSFLKPAENFMRGSAGQKRIPVSYIASLKVPVLKSVDLEKIDQSLEIVEALLNLYHRKLSLLQELQKSLATRAFAGLL
ncbi:restriction endonuclease subunit S [Corynebacterium matruchotii]|jgi:hypothetical protein|uniref:Type I restriction modification DNA specificity domain protein n=1 Tax=Corynebacterium matruchotii ATCC 33806 TaxID=566549 RepID=C0E6A7_9CORY|nr:restriction endonuclease subunit S [Corynebacterium matruchotii]EEG25948.1 type I restriction modification DNA specificity domain protein [Corynebacterium matruchotii ATCC 33806]